MKQTELGDRVFVDMDQSDVQRANVFDDADQGYEDKNGTRKREVRHGEKCTAQSIRASSVKSGGNWRSRRKYTALFLKKYTELFGL